MEINNKVDAKFKREFNLGYQVAKELNLNAPMFSDEQSAPTNIVYLGMLQFIKEAEGSNKKDLKTTLTSAKNKSSKISGNNKDKGLSI